MRKLIITVCTILLLTGLARAQDTTSFNFTVDHIALSVKDVDISAGFYNNILKLTEITNRSKLEGVRWFSLGEGKELHLIALIKEPMNINKAVHLALTTSKFDSFVTLLEKRGIPYTDWPGKPKQINVRADGIKQLFFQDPDGYWIEINSVNQR